jgi:hypothetical protein
MSENNPIAQEGEVLITNDNMCDRQNQDLTGMEAVLLSELFNMETDPVKIEKRNTNGFSASAVISSLKALQTNIGVEVAET